MKKYVTFPFLIRIGLACVFLANSLTAFLTPDEFQELVSGSFVAGILGSLSISVAAFVTFIGVNDLVVAILLVLGWRTTYVARYATAWMLGVIFVIGALSLDALEHLGFLAMTVVLAVRGKTD